MGFSGFTRETRRHGEDKLRVSVVFRIRMAVVICSLLAGVCAQAAELRVVSLGPAITDQVCLLGLARYLAGVTTYCRLPAEIPRPMEVGTVTGISTEQIVALGPDLVLATGLTHPRDAGKLEQLGIRVIRFDYAKNFDDICGQFLQLGELLERGAEAREIVEAARTRVDALAGTVQGRAAPRVFVEVGTRPLFTANRDSYIDDMVARAGGQNVARDIEGGYYSRERVLAENPDVIVIVTMGVEVEEEKAAWLATEALQVAKTGRVYVMDAYTVCSPTPPRFAEAAEAMAALFHPETAERP